DPTPFDLVFCGRLGLFEDRPGRNLSLGETKPDEPAVHAPVCPHPRDDFLPDVAAFPRRNPFVQTDLVREVTFFGVIAETRPAPFDPQDFGRFVRNSDGAALLEPGLSL